MGFLPVVTEVPGIHFLVCSAHKGLKGNKDKKLRPNTLEHVSVFTRATIGTVLFPFCYLGLFNIKNGKSAFYFCTFQLMFV